ncbi:alpha/beta hydrolase [Sutterella sp.]|uniref:alpha/beta hydrolase n=1 Tax=Sutterella sp. TaxID=1981025 RepID=UPI0026E0E50D|nr:alpha/beta hydrolase [Sutterella sp.]MDO5531505.1 alpha/beta hydrolase [Sutterella sp.]
MKKLALLCAMTIAFAGAAGSVSASENDLTFPRDPAVTLEKVNFKDRYDITLAGHLYLPQGVTAGTASKHPAIIVGHPFGGVKEQTAGLYAQELAKRGFVTLAFDLAFGGESGGTPRQTVSPEIYVDDFSAAVDFLGSLKFVDAERIGVLGICGSGGFVVSAASWDPRMKAVATVSMYDMGRQRRQGLGDTVSRDQMRKNLEAIFAQRTKEYAGAEPLVIPGTPKVLPENPNPIAKEFFEYYRTERGSHPNYIGVRRTSDAALMNFFPFSQIDLISPRPVLFVVGDHAHSRYFSEDAYEKAAEPKELYVVPDAGHVDLYDRMDRIPFDKLEKFFRDNLAAK